METQTIKQPKALYLLNFVSMWECFSYYGMRVLLVLFMTEELRLSDAQAFLLYALYTTLVEFGGVIGGIVADRYLGLKRSITLGGWTIALGHLCLSLPDSTVSFFAGLGLIVAGTSFFRTNVPAFLGEFYEQNDPRKDAGYTIYYTGINIGGFLASIFCGFVGEVYGWHAGFGLAALGMLAGNIALWAGSHLLNDNANPTPIKIEDKSYKKECIGALMLAVITPVCALMLYHYDMVMTFFPAAFVAFLYYAYSAMKTCTRQEKNALKSLCVYIGFLILFYACEEQLGSTLILFSERHIDRASPFGIIPAASLIMFNPLTILALGPLLSKRIGKIPISPLGKIGCSFVLLASAYATLWMGCLFASDKEIVPLSYAIGSIVLIAAGEILIGPTIYAAASEASPKNHVGLTMSLVTIGFACANLVSGWISQTMAITDSVSSIDVYANGFYTIGLASLVLAIGIIIVNKKIKAVTI